MVAPMSRTWRRLAAAIALAATGALAGITAVRARTPASTSARFGAEVLVSAAASLTDALTALAADYEAEAGVHVVLNFGSSSGLARQIVNGAPVDVFLSADEAQMDTVARAGLIDEASRIDLLSNQLVVVMPSGAAPVDLARALASSPVRRLALANPEAVPAGVYAKRYLEAEGLWAAVASKVVPTLDVRSALAAVDSGSADAAFVYRTDAAVARSAVVVFEVPRASGPSIAYPAAMVRNAPHAVAARAWLAYLCGPHARTVFERFGFVVTNVD